MTFRKGDGLPITAAKEQLSVKFVGLLCANISVTFVETPPGQDFFGVDASIGIPEVTVEVQVKSSSQPRTMDSGDLYLKPEQGWVDKWNRQANPLYIIYVHILRDDTLSWLSGQFDHTQVHAVGYWTLYKEQQGTANIIFPKNNILSSETIQDWLEICKTRGYGA